MPVTPQRVDAWVHANIHVAGRPDWVLIKVHGHAASSTGDLEETIGPDFDNALTYLEKRYNDGQHYLLHYVTARETYNIIRAAADGKQGIRSSTSICDSTLRSRCDACGGRGSLKLNLPPLHQTAAH